MNYYKITKEQADAIGYFKYSDCEAFDPKCSEQSDGTYLVSETMYNMLKDRPEFSKVDFMKLSRIDKSQINTKPVTI